MTGASPSVGSSTSSTRGCAIRARPIDSICCSPPDSVLPRARSLSLSRGKWLSTRSIDAGTWARSRQIPIERFSATVSFGKISRSSGT